MAGWQYDAKSRRYRSEETGRYLSPKAMVGLRDQFTDSLKAKASDLATRRSEGDLSQNDWERQMRTLIKFAHVDMAALGRGGRRQMAPADWGRVGQAIRTQYAFLGRFADDTRELSEAQIRARAGLYVEAATAAYERGRAAAWDVTLPDYPASGNQRCMTNCRCSWVLVDTESAVEATWTLGAAEHCEDCLENAARWAPLVIVRQAAPLVGANLTL